MNKGCRLSPSASLLFWPSLCSRILRALCLALVVPCVRSSVYILLRARTRSRRGHGGYVHTTTSLSSVVLLIHVNLLASRTIRIPCVLNFCRGSKRRAQRHTFCVLISLSFSLDSIFCAWEEGCACDIRAHWYSFSEDQNPDWSSIFAGGKDIHDYWLHIVDKHKLRPHTQCNTGLIGAEWHAQRNVWTCHFRTSDGKTQDVETKILVTCFGPFTMPSFPDIPGIDDYQGIKFHSARWRHDVDLSHKSRRFRSRILCVCPHFSRPSPCDPHTPLSAQFVPVMTRNKTTQITHFIRTPAWFVPRYNSPVPEHYKWIFPGSLRLYRNYLYAVVYRIGLVLRAILMIF